MLRTTVCTRRGNAATSAIEALNEGGAAVESGNVLAVVDCIRAIPMTLSIDPRPTLLDGPLIAQFESEWTKFARNPRAGAALGHGLFFREFCVSPLPGPAKRAEHGPILRLKARFLADIRPKCARGRSKLTELSDLLAANSTAGCENGGERSLRNVRTPRSLGFEDSE